MRVNNLKKNFKDVEALKGISFEFEAPSFVGVIGHNGSGKTTMLEILMGIQTATSGTIDYSNEFELKSTTKTSSPEKTKGFFHVCKRSELSTAQNGSLLKT